MHGYAFWLYRPQLVHVSGTTSSNIVNNMKLSTESMQSKE